MTGVFGRKMIGEAQRCTGPPEDGHRHWRSVATGQGTLPSAGNRQKLKEAGSAFGGSKAPLAP